MQDTILANNAVVIHLHARIKDGIVANLDIVTYIGVWVDLYAFAKLDILADVGKSSDICVIGDNHTFAHEGWLLYALLGRVHGLCHKREELSHGCAGILHADEGGIGLAIEGNRLGHEHDAGTRLWQVREILGIAEER